MRDQLMLLYELQQIDSGIDRHRRNIAALDDGSRARKALSKATDELDALQKKFAADEASLRDRELQLKGAEEEREQKRKRAGQSSSNPREVAALDRKIEELTRLKGRLEEEILVLMDEVELGRARVAEQTRSVEKLQKDAEEAEATYTSARKRLKQEVATLAARREELAPQVGQALLTQYEGIREKAEGLAVVPVKSGTCGGCQTAVPTSSVAASREGKTVVRCESCRRILFTPE